MTHRLPIAVAMLIAISDPAFVMAQVDGVQLPTVSSPYLVLIRDPVIHELLKLDEKQQKAVRELTDKVDGPLWRSRALAARENAAEVARLIAHARKAMAEILSPAQQERMSQAERRVIGMQSLFIPQVRNDLKLLGGQLKKIVTTLEATQKDQADLQKIHQKSPELLQQRLDKLFADEKKKIAEILDQDQHRQLRALVGEPFDLSRLGNVRFKAPELDGADGWINSRGLRMADLRGRVTVLHFWTYG